MALPKRALFQPGAPAARPWGTGIKGGGGAQQGRQVPAQLRGARFAPAPIAQQKYRCPAALGAHAEAPAGGEIENLGLARHVGDHGRNRPAAQRFFSRPQQFGDIGRADQHQVLGIKAEKLQPAAIGQAHLLGIGRHLQINHCLTHAAQQAAGLPQGESQHSAAIAPFIGKHFMHHPWTR